MPEKAAYDQAIRDNGSLDRNAARSELDAQPDLRAALSELIDAITDDGVSVHSRSLASLQRVATAKAAAQAVLARTGGGR